MGKSKLSMTNWPCHVWSHTHKKKLWWSNNKVALGVCYWLLCTDLGDRILCTSTPNHNIHGENGVYQRWTMCVSGKKKCIRNAFSSNLETKISKNFPRCPTDSTKSKENQSLGKNDCIKKCFDKSLDWDRSIKWALNLR